MMRVIALLFSLMIAAPSAAEDNPMPDYLKDLDRAYHSGDWTLQCNGSQFCQIVGVAKIPKDYVGVRAVVMINRGIARDAKPVLRMAFIDAMGSLGVPPPADGWRLYSRGLPKMQPPIKLPLGEAQADGAYRAAPELAAKIISALRRWQGSVIHDRGLKIATMPRGNLDYLMRKMDRLQHPKRPRMTDAEKTEWLKEYHYTILRSSLVDELPTPDLVLLSCDTRTYVNQPFGARIGPSHVLWTADCPEGTKIFVQKGIEDPISFEVRNNAGQIQRHSFAGLDDSSLLHIRMPRKGDDSCGRHLKMGFNGEAFNMIEDRRYERCRALPYEFWPVMWAPTSWKYADPPPTNEGNAPPSAAGVIIP